jgi:uncharacterized protein (TIRG00374 family)
MKTHWKTLLKIAISLGLILLLLSNIDTAALGKTLARAHRGWLTMTVLLFILSILLRTLRWRTLTRARGMTSSFWQLARWYYVGAFFNTLLPTGFGGDVAKSVYLAKESGDAGGAVGTVVLDRFLGILVLLGVGAVAAPFSRAHISIWVQLFVIGIFVVALTGFWILRRESWIRWLRARTLSLLPHRLSHYLENLASLRSLYFALQDYDTATLSKAIFYSLIFNASWILINITAGLALGVQAGLLDYLIFVPLVSLALLIPSIGGIGVRELSYVGLFTQVGVPAESAFAMSIVVYLATVITGLVGGLLMLF